MRPASTYRAARNAGSGAVLQHSPVHPSQIKHRPVESSPLMPAEQRFVRLASIRSHRAAQRALLGMPLGRLIQRPVSKEKSAPFKGHMAKDSNLRNLMRNANRNGGVSSPNVKAMKRHAWFRKQIVLLEMAA